MPTNYLAFTIGPIYQTMAGARYTRELWASSYLFSYLVKVICQRVVEEIPGRFIVPAVVGGLDDLFKPADKRQLPTHGSGLFPDRFIFQTEQSEQLEKLQTIFDAVLQKLATNMQRTAGINGAVLPFLRNYVKLYALETTVAANENVILKLMPYLDTLELQHNFNATDEPFLRELFNRVTKSFLVRDAFGEGQHSFETILEVATRDFSHLVAYRAIGAKRIGWQPKPQRPVSLTEAIGDSKADDADEIDELDKSEPIAEETKLITYLTENHRVTRKPKPDQIFRPAHKYIAVVQADGDNVGRVIETLKAEDYEKFSKQLGAFALNAVDEISRFGGLNIYAGGDDLLFFAPLLYQNETLFDLLVRLDNRFTQMFAEFPVEEGKPSPTLSFGVSITYYKFPLYEAREAAVGQLFGVAKHTDGKNTVALRVQKHSGQPFGGAFRINSPSFVHLMNLLRFTSEEDGLMLTSVVHKIHETEFLLKQIGHDRTALRAFFDNSFNEAIHINESEAKAFLQAVVDLLSACFTQYAGDAKAALDAAYALLRTHRFLTSTELN